MGWITSRSDDLRSSRIPPRANLYARSYASTCARSCARPYTNPCNGSATALLLAILLVLVCRPGHAANSSIGASLGSAGVGVEFTTGLHPKLRLRGLISGVSVALDGIQDGIDYSVDVSTFYAGALLDFHPAANAFRMTIGLMLAEPDIALESVTSQNNYAIGDRSYSGTLNLKGNASFNPMAPWFSIGWASNLQGKGFFWSGDLGFAYIGEPQLELSATGTATDDAIPSSTPFDVTNSADFLEQLDRERLALQDEYSSFQIAPILNIGFGYRF